MEIKFENKVLGSYREVFHQLRQIQENAETVVPDTNDDIGRIASVHTSVLLKSKDISGKGVSVSGEAGAVLLYITENGNSVSYLKIAKPFSLEYEISDLEADTVPQINLRISNAEARILNPRKVSVTFEIAAELSCYRPVLTEVETKLPEGCGPGIHAKYESIELELPNAVCEKTFALNEQYIFPSGKPLPSELVFQTADFCIDESQHIGSKIIIKGRVNTEVCYLSQDTNYPVRTEFSTGFSQIIDTGEEEMDSCTAVICLTSVYCELIDTINSEKALDCELHALIQVVSRCRRRINYISDAYSNIMPAECTVKSSQISEVSGMLSTKMNADELVSVSDDFSDVLSVFASLTQVSALRSGFSAGVCFDIIYMGKDGLMSCARRIVNLEQNCAEINARVMNCSMEDMDIRPEGGELRCRLSLNICYQSSRVRELSRVTELELNEDERYDVSACPAVSLVHRDNEELWELAKSYHSSIESIEKMNSAGENEGKNLLLIPREMQV